MALTRWRSPMNWWLRMELGLPPRKEDLIELRKAAPEIFYSRHREWKNDAFLARLVAWMRSADEHDLYGVIRDDAQSAESRRDSGPQHTSELECPHPECPLRRPTSDSAGGAHDKHSVPGAISEVARLHLMSLGGGAKALLNIFLNVARQVHSHKEKIIKLVITDGYLFTTTSEHGTP